MKQGRTIADVSGKKMIGADPLQAVLSSPSSRSTPLCTIPSSSIAPVLNRKPGKISSVIVQPPGNRRAFHDGDLMSCRRKIRRADQAVVSRANDYRARHENSEMFAGSGKRARQFTHFGDDRSWIEGHERAIRQKPAAIHPDIRDRLGTSPIHNLLIRIVHHRRAERIAVEAHDIGALTGFERPVMSPSPSARAPPIVAILQDLPRVGRLGVLPMNFLEERAELHHFDHVLAVVAGHSVGADPHGDAVRSRSRSSGHTPDARIMLAVGL